MAEPRDLSIRAIGIFGVSLFVTIALALLAMVWLRNFWQSTYIAQQPPPLPVSTPPQPPPTPRLQVDAPLDLQRWRAVEDAMLNNYEWVDRDHGVVRIPIERAMELVEQRGLPK